MTSDDGEEVMLNIQPIDGPLPADPHADPGGDLHRGAIRFWFYEGIVLPAGDRWVSTHDLLEFAQLAQKHYPNEKVWLHQYGLRVTKTAGESGPRLDWRDWD